MIDLTAADDHFHAVGDDDPLWTETTWWGFQVPSRSLGGMVYTLFRPNLGVATLVVQVWDADAVEPWRAPYARGLWHLAHPEGELTKCELGALTMECHEPLTRYRLTYADGDALSFTLDYTGLAAPFAVPARGGGGHFDHACQVTGSLVLAGTTIEVDAPAVRDRSWYVRRDLRTMRAGYTYGVVDAGEHFVVHSGGGPTDDTMIVSGYLERDGARQPLTGGTRRVVSRRRGHPDLVELTAEDAMGRSLVATGRVTCALASQSTPGMFAWMSMCDWDVEGRQAVGEDHDVWSPDHLAMVRPFA